MNYLEKRDLKNRMSTFFTADTHFGHSNIIKHCNRPFADVNEMNEALIANWNSMVTPYDTVYIVGDFAYCSKTPPEEFLTRLNGKKHLISGNHDRDYFNATKGKELNQHWTYEGNYKEVTLDGRKLVLCHYPMMSWTGQKRGSLMIHGHTHNKQDEQYMDLWRQMPNLLNASVDINGFKPVTLDDLIENNAKVKAYADFPPEHDEGCGCQPLFDYPESDE